MCNALCRPQRKNSHCVRPCAAPAPKEMHFENQQRAGRGDDDPYAFLADADLAASYSEKDSWAEGAATLLVGVDLPGAALDFDASISELTELAKGAGLHIVGPPLRRRLRQPDPQTYTDSQGWTHPEKQLLI